MLSAALSVFLLLGLIFGGLAWVQRHEIREWLEGFFIEVIAE